MGFCTVPGPCSVPWFGLFAFVNFDPGCSFEPLPMLGEDLAWMIFLGSSLNQIDGGRCLRGCCCALHLAGFDYIMPVLSFNSWKKEIGGPC